MSRILRRPMFRGGPVSSYGTGIASGLGYNTGGRVGYSNGGGIITLQDILKQGGAPMKGQQILDFAEKNKLNLGPNFKINPMSTFIPEQITIDEGTENERDISYADFVGKFGIPKYEDEKSFLGGDDTQGSIGDVDLNDGRKFSANFGTNEQVKKKLEKKPVQEVSFSATADGDVTTVDENDLDSLIDRYYKQLGGDKARQEYVGDALAAASEKFFEGDMGGALVAAAKTKTKEPEIKRAAAMLGIKGEQAQKLYETKLRNTTGQLQKAVEYIKNINPGMSDKEALATYQRRPRSLSETVGKYKKEDGVIMPSGITLAAGEWFLDEYKGELPTDGNIKEGDKAVGKGNGAYTDKAKGLIFVIKDEVVTDVNKFEN